jgi:two-component sensor histidine kinase
VRLDADGIVSYASPNALTAYRRLGLATDLVGTHLGKLTAELAPTTGPVDEALPVVASGRAPREIEVEVNAVVVHLRAIPLDPYGTRIGAIVLLRDVSELRRRERELLTKDATIREIHHRVKNNLQTVAALLRLQARRLDEPQARSALDEAVRRVGSIAIVHDTLSQSLDENVDFDEVADRVLAMVAEVSAPETYVRPRREGSFGVLPAEIATPLSLVLTELLQNALEHGLGERPHRPGTPGRPGSSGTLGTPGRHEPQGPTDRADRLDPTSATDRPGGTLQVIVDRRVGRLRLEVADNGRGLPVGFDPETSGSLGLQIVRTLSISELGGTLDIGPRAGGGTRVVLDFPVKS